MWLARNMERFCDSWIDWGSAIFLRNCAALKHGVAERNTQATRLTRPLGLRLPPDPSDTAPEARQLWHHR